MDYISTALNISPAEAKALLSKSADKTADAATAAKKAEKVGDKAAKSTGRTEPKNLTEKLAMEEVKSNPNGTTPPRMPAMSDTKNGWVAEDGWVKRVQNVNGVEIHYIENTKTGVKTDFKFKD